MVMAPIMPFMMEYIWQNQVREVEKTASLSVMMSGFDIATYKIDDESVLDKTNIVRSIIASALKLRNENNLKVKQPLKKAFVISANTNALKAIEDYKSIIEEELNIKEIELTTDVETFNDHYLTLNFRNAGKVLKGDVQKMKVALENTDDVTMNKYVSELETGKVSIKDFGEMPSDMFIKNSKPKQEFIMESADDMTVVLDITLTQELINEGILREIIRNAQILRKEANFEIDDRIDINIKSKDVEIQNIINSNNDKIKSEVLGNTFNEISFTPEITKEVEVGNNQKVEFELRVSK